MEEKIDKILKGLLPHELEVIKRLIETLISDKQKKRNTNLNYLEKIKNVRCPNNSQHPIKKKELKDIFVRIVKKFFIIGPNIFKCYT